MNIETFHHASLREPRTRSALRAKLWRHRWLLLFVVLPTLMGALYFGFIASDVYVSQSRFVIKAPGQKTMPSTTLANLIQTNGFGGGEQETKEVLDYLGSRTALADLQRQMDVRARYQNAGADFLSRFPKPFREPSFENLFKYYQSMVQVGTDTESGVAILEVRAFRPEDARAINARLLGLSEDLVNRLNERAERRGVAEAEQRVEQAQMRVSNARVSLAAFRNEQQLIDPTKQATGVLDISNKLVSEHAALQAQLQLMERVAPANPSIPALRARISAVAAEIAAQNARVVGTPTGIASKVGGYEKLLAEQDFAQQTLTAASMALEQARVEAQKQQFYLERVVDPNLPDAPALPNRLRSILIVLGVTLSLYFIGWMLVVGVLEHSPES
jgi:capsular polysaccharide transport system permease protein